MRVMILLFAAGMLATVVALSAGSPPSSSRADDLAGLRVEALLWDATETMEELCELVDLIVVGTVQGTVAVHEASLFEMMSEEVRREVEARYEEMRTLGRQVPAVPAFHFTDSLLSVEHVLKGSESLSEVVIRQRGEPGDQLDEDPLLNVGDRYVLFLHVSEGVATMYPFGPYARYRVVGDDVFSMAYIVYPELLRRDLSEYYDEPYGFHLRARGMEQQTFLDWVIDSIPPV